MDLVHPSASLLHASLPPPSLLLLLLRVLLCSCCWMMAHPLQNIWQDQGLHHVVMDIYLHLSRDHHLPSLRKKCLQFLVLFAENNDCNSRSLERILPELLEEKTGLSRVKCPSSNSLIFDKCWCIRVSGSSCSSTVTPCTPLFVHQLTVMC